MATLGIALGGGGAKGYAHIGILEVLQENNIDCGVVAGTSIGALVGAAYAADALKQLTEKSSGIRLQDIPGLLGPTVSKTGLFSGKRVQAMLGEIVQYERIEELPRRFAAVSTDIATGTLVVSSCGNIREAVRASISIPALFTPIRRDGSLLVDGGLVEPVPVEICRTLGADIVIAVDLFGNQSQSPISDEEQTNALWAKGILDALSYLRSISSRLKLPAFFGDNQETPSGEPNTLPSLPTNVIEVIESTLSVSQKALTESRLIEHPPDLLLQPAVKDVGLLDFHRGAATIEIGRQCALALLPTIEALIKDSAKST